MALLKNLFSESLTSADRRPVLYEMLPPPEDARPEDRKEFLRIIAKLLADVHVDAINVPEVRAEAGQTTDKGAQTVSKGDPRPFAAELSGRFSGIPVIVNHVVVNEPREAFQAWVRQSYQDYGLRNLIFVGGESGRVHYPGPTVSEASAWVTGEFNRTATDGPVLVGGIIIPTRRHADPERDEPRRLIRKAASGIDFFTSQVVYEADSMKKLLADYDALCRQSGVAPKRIFISFAPVSNAKDVQFLRWLGVEIPATVEKKLQAGWIGMGWRSVETCQAILGDILSFAAAERITVPLGINVEHIMKYNVELSKELLISLSKQLHI